jgi:glucose/mannose-6-phosphate isomerase
MTENYDKEDMMAVLDGFHDQVDDGYDLAGSLAVEGPIDKIMISGMGGSALAGEILHSYMDSKIPIFLNKEYDLPEFVDSKTLIFASSYSGNTEETIQAYRHAIRKGCKIVVITSGGKLDILAKKNGHKAIMIPRGFQPRMTYAYMFFAILRVLANSKIIDDPRPEVESLANTLKSSVFKEKAEELADVLVGKIPIIYTSQRMHAVGYKWKINFNENTKIHAFSNVFPELNHNEILGYTDVLGDFHTIILRNDQDHQRIQLRMDVTKGIIKEKGVQVTEIGLTGSNHLSKIFSGIYIGDWVSYFLAIKNKRDPTPVAIIEDLKKKIAE